MEVEKLSDTRRKWAGIENLGSSGFTLIEILMALAVLGIVAGVSVTVFLSVMQSYTKSVIINKLRSEGSRVMEDLSRVVKGGNELIGVGAGPPYENLTVILDRESLEYAQNGNCETVNFVYQLAGSDYNNGILKNLSDCDGTKVGEGEITDDDWITGVNVSSVSYTVTDGGGLRPDQINIELVLEQGLGAPSRKEYAAGVTLRNTVSTRDY